MPFERHATAAGSREVRDAGDGPQRVLSPQREHPLAQNFDLLPAPPDFGSTNAAPEPAADLALHLDVLDLIDLTLA